ncbi:hypothetical protein Hanom_Chr14g01319871 [Helianthus anomalus]
MKSYNTGETYKVRQHIRASIKSISDVPLQKKCVSIELSLNLVLNMSHHH